MKTECPVCHREGFAEKRGSNVRIKHYVGYENGKRIYCYHRIPEILGINGNQSLGINRQNLNPAESLEPSAGFGPATITLPR